MRNAQAIITLAKQAAQRRVAVVAFPELCLTGYTARDLFLDNTLKTAVDDALEFLVEQSKHVETTLIIGCPLESVHRMYNTAVVIAQGCILGVVPKRFMPRSAEFEETRWFRSGDDLLEREMLLCGFTVPFGIDLIFRDGHSASRSFGIEICEDLWHAKPPSSVLYQEGALAMFNLSASNFLVGKAQRRRLLARASASRGVGGYVYVAAGPTESSTDLAFDADAFICERDELMAESVRFSRDSQLICADLDLTSLVFERRKNQVFGDGTRAVVRYVDAPLSRGAWPPERRFSRRPFVSEDLEQSAVRNWEVFEIQSNALATRMKAIGTPKLILGLSGGIDSTHAALVCVEALRICGQPHTDLVCIGMPGFGSSDATQDNGHRLATALGLVLEVLPISSIATQILKDVRHPVAQQEHPTADDVVALLRQVPALGDTSFENVQARLRTLLLMTKANQLGGIVVGTGDLSEKALGWSTYSGDQIAMYDVNAGVPKSLIQDVMRWVVAHRANRWGTELKALKTALQAVLDTPISPELLPPNEDGEVAQLTEAVLGPYIIHDFLLYHFHVHGRSFDEILDLARLSFEGTFDDESLRSYALTFVKRFFTQQFKRSCTPDAPKVLSVGLSPRGDWRMPSDAQYAIWLDTIEQWVPERVNKT
jgi:NAD+ synthase (glutamine-hydrolysing)